MSQSIGSAFFSAMYIECLTHYLAYTFQNIVDFIKKRINEKKINALTQGKYIYYFNYSPLLFFFFKLSSFYFFFFREKEPERLHASTQVGCGEGQKESEGILSVFHAPWAQFLDTRS